MSITSLHEIGGLRYVSVATDGPNVLVQLQSQGPLCLIVQDSLPDSETRDGIILSESGLTEVGLTIETGDSVYVRSLSDTDQRVATVATSPA